MNNKFRYILGLSAIVLLSGALSAQSLNLQQCREMAVKYNKELKNSENQKQQALLQKKIATTAYLPSVSASATGMFSPKDIDINMPGGFLPTANSIEEAQAGQFTGLSNVYSPGMSSHLDNLTFVNSGISASQPIFAGGKIYNANQQAKIGIQISNYAYDLKFSEVIEATDQAFWNIVAVESSIDMLQTYIDMLAELETQMSQMVDLGLQPKSEKLKVSVQKNEADLQMLRAKNGLKLSKMQLNQIVGMPLNNEVNLEYDKLEADNLKLNDGIEAARRNRAELKILENQVALSRIDKKMEMADYLPQLGVNAQYSNLYVNDLVEDGGMTFMLGAKLTIPIFSWGQGYRKQQLSDLKIEMAQTKLDNTNEMIALEVLQVQTQIEEALESIKIASKSIDQTEESLEETKASFEAGMNTITELLNAQADWQNAQAQYIQAVAQYKLLQTSWEKVTGNLSAQKY